MYKADYDERDERLAEFGELPDCRDIRSRWGLCVARDSSSIFAEATPTLAAVGLPGLLGYAAKKDTCIYIYIYIFTYLFLSLSNIYIYIYISLSIYI